MKKFLLLVTVTAVFNSFAQAPQVEWSKAYGGSGFDEAYTLMQSTDGGYIFAGGTYSSDNDVMENFGSSDIWVVKLNSQGQILWENTYGGEHFDNGFLQATPDAGFIIGGRTESFESGNIYVAKFNSMGEEEWSKIIEGGLNKILPVNDGYLIIGDQYDFNNPTGIFSDISIIKLDINGEIVWQNFYGENTKSETSKDILATSDGGFVVLGAIPPNNNHYDVWLFKINGDGVVQWEQTYGGDTYNDSPSYIVSTNDGGYAITAQSASFSNSWDIVVYKTSSSGELQWQSVIGGSNVDYGIAKQTADGGFIVSGYTHSNDGDAIGTQGIADILVVKLNENGEKVWGETYGGNGGEFFGYIYQNNIFPQIDVANILETNNGYILLGMTQDLSTGSLPGSHGEEDSWLLKINLDGAYQWGIPFGGSEDDVSTTLIRTIDGGYATIGYTLSNNGDVTGYNGMVDIWVTKFGPETLSSGNFTAKQLSVYPNPAISQLNIVLPHNTVAETVSVIDVTGKKVLQQSGTQTLNIENLQSGIYFIEVSSQEALYRSKFIKE